MVCPARKGKTVNIDPREIAALAAAQPAAPRVDMYAGIHKALRTCMTDTLLALGRMDTDDDLEFAQTCDRVMQLLDLCRSHLHHDNDFVHTAMQARAPGSSATLPVRALVDGLGLGRCRCHNDDNKSKVALHEPPILKAPTLAFEAANAWTKDVSRSFNIPLLKDTLSILQLSSTYSSNNR